MSTFGGGLGGIANAITTGLGVANAVTGILGGGLPGQTSPCAPNGRGAMVRREGGSVQLSRCLQERSQHSDSSSGSKECEHAFERLASVGTAYEGKEKGAEASTRSRQPRRSLRRPSAPRPAGRRNA